MKRLFLALVLAAASFGVYWLAVHPPDAATPVPFLGLTRWGLADQDGNATAAFFIFNASQSSQVQIAIFEKPVARRVWLWDDSDQSRFRDFSQALAGYLASNGIAVSRTTGSVLESEEPGVLIVAASAMPSELVRNDSYISMMERGWVILYSGFPPTFMLQSGRIVPNPLWLSQGNRLDVAVEPESAVPDFRFSVHRSDAFQAGSWMVVPYLDGAWAVLPKLLDVSFADADSAAASFSGFIRHANWTRPVASFMVNVSDGSPVVLPLPSGVRTQEAWILSDVNGSRRQAVSLRSSSHRLIHPSSWRANRPLSAAFLLNLSIPAAMTLSLSGGRQELHRQELGLMPSGVSWHSVQLPSNFSQGPYVVELSGSDGSHAYSVLRLFSYRVQVEHVDSASRLIAARLWASDHPASGVEFSWAEKPGRTDGEGRFRVVDPELSEGVNRRSLDVDGVAVPFEYGSSSGILSSWPDRLLALGAVGLFGVAWWANRRAAVRIRLLPPEFHPLRVHVPSALFARLFEDVPKASALSVREFTARLHTLLADPQLVLPPEQIRKLLQDAESRGAVLLKGNAATWLAHHASKTGALEALFWRNVSDGLLAQGWSFRRLGARLYCRRDKRARILDARPTDGKVRWRGTVHWHSVDDAGPEYFR